MTNKQLKRHIARIRFNWVMVCIFALIAAIAISGSVLLSDYYYERWLNPKEGSPQEQVQSLQRAIDFRPREGEGYHYLLDVYLNDGVLTEAENTAFRAFLTKHQESLNKVPEKAVTLYRRLAFAYISSYDGPAEERMDMAYRYFELTKPYADATSLEVTAIDTYLALGQYYAEYVYLAGSLRQPSRAEVENLIRRISGLMDAFQQSPSEDALAFTCCVAAILDTNGEEWSNLADADLVAALIEKVQKAQFDALQTPVALRLQKELAAWQTVQERK